MAGSFVGVVMMKMACMILCGDLVSGVPLMELKTVQTMTPLFLEESSSSSWASLSDKLASSSSSSDQLEDDSPVSPLVTWSQWIHPEDASLEHTLYDETMPAPHSGMSSSSSSWMHYIKPIGNIPVDHYPTDENPDKIHQNCTHHIFSVPLSFLDQDGSTTTPGMTPPTAAASTTTTPMVLLDGDEPDTVHSIKQGVQARVVLGQALGLESLFSHTIQNKKVTTTTDNTNNNNNNDNDDDKNCLVEDLIPDFVQATEPFPSLLAVNAMTATTVVDLELKHFTWLVLQVPASCHTTTTTCRVQLLVYEGMITRVQNAQEYEEWSSGTVWELDTTTTHPEKNALSMETQFGGAKVLVIITLTANGVPPMMGTEPTNREKATTGLRTPTPPPVKVVKQADRNWDETPVTMLRSNRIHDIHPHVVAVPRHDTVPQSNHDNDDDNDDNNNKKKEQLSLACCPPPNGYGTDRTCGYTSFKRREDVDCFAPKRAGSYIVTVPRDAPF